MHVYPDSIGINNVVKTHECYLSLNGIVQFPMVTSVFLNSYQRLSQTKEPFSESHAIIKITCEQQKLDADS